MIARAVAPSPARVNTVAPRVRRVRTPISRVARVDVNASPSMRRVARPARARSRARVRRVTARARSRGVAFKCETVTHTRNGRDCRVYPRRYCAHRVRHIAFARCKTRESTHVRRPIETRDARAPTNRNARRRRPTPRVPTESTHTPTRARWRRAARTTRRDARVDSRRIARRARRRGRGSGRSSGTRGDAWTRSSG